MTDLSDYMTTRISNYAPGRTDGGAGTLEAIRRRDYNALDLHATLVIVDQAITYLRSRRETLEPDAARLEQLRPVLEPPTGAKTATASPVTSTSSTPPRMTAPANGSTSAPIPTNKPKPWSASRPTRSWCRCAPRSVK